MLNNILDLNKPSLFRPRC